MTNPLKSLLTVTMLAMVAGCGGSAGDSSSEATYALSGTVTGLNGKLVVSVNTNEIELDSNGNISLGNGFSAGTGVNLAIKTQPEGQECAFTSSTSITFARSDINNVAIACNNLTYNIGGTATGLGREFTLAYSHDGQAGNLVIPADGAFVFPAQFPSGTELSFSVPATVGHHCSITPTSVVVTTDLSNLVLDCTTFGQINGQVNAYSTGAPIANADIEVYVVAADGEASLLQVVQSAENGAFMVNGAGYYERISLRAKASGYATRSEVVRTSEINPDTAINIAMLNVGFNETFAATAAVELNDPATALRISLPANAFVDAQGNRYTGQVSAAVTNIDASSDPAIMPGYYLAIDPETNTEMSFESFGALNATFSDAQGNSLQLAENITALIRIPLATRGTNPPATIPLIHFNEQSGIWNVEGEATLMTDEQGRQYYAGEVSHFSTWNADFLFDSVAIIGCALDDDTQVAIPGARLIADGVDYIGRSVAYTNAAGEFSIAVRPNSQVLLSIRDADGQSNTTRIDVGSSDYNLNNCITTDQGAMIVSLTWNENPHDLDTHFKGPLSADSLTDRFHIYFSNRTATVEGVTMYLDVDDTSSFGPEILTVPRFPLPGRYVYSVHHFSGSGTIYQSPARVEVLLNGNSYVFAPSVDEDTNGSNDTWMVFEILVLADGTVELTPLDTYTQVGNNDVPAAAAYATPMSRTSKASKN